MADAPENAPSDTANARVHPYIACLDLSGRCCVVVGGGSVAARKVTALLDSAANVRVIAPAAVERVTMLAQVGRIELINRAYESSDLAGAMLVFAATNQPDVNAQVARDARAAGALCNVADESAQGDFSVPATLTHGDLTVAVSTSGRAPGYARRLRDLIAVRIGPEYGQALALYASVREAILAAPVESQHGLWDTLFALDLPHVIHNNGKAAADIALAAWLSRQQFD